MKCVNGHDLGAGETFCTICGSAVASTGVAQSCTAGHVVPPGSSFCSQCGVEVVESNSSNSGRSIPKWLLIAAPAVVVLVGLIIAAFVLLGGAKQEKLRIGVDVFNTTCDQIGTNSDHYSGEEVTVRDQNGQVLAKGALGDPTDDSEYDSTNTLVDTCTLYSTVQVPGDRTLYKVDSGSGGNSVSFNVSELKNHGWHADIAAGY